MSIRLHRAGILVEIRREDDAEEEALAAVLDDVLHDQFGSSPNWECDPE